MVNPKSLKMKQLSDTLWMIEDWIRAVREVLMTNEDTTLTLPEVPTIVALDDTGQIKLLRGCPPPETDKKGGKGGKGGKGKGKGKDKGKGKGGSKKGKKTTKTRRPKKK